MIIGLISDPPYYGTGFGQQARYLTTALAALGHDVRVYSMGTAGAVEFEDRDRLPGVRVAVRPLADLLVEDDGLDVLIGLWNPMYMNDVALYYDLYFIRARPKQRKIGYFVHEARAMPRGQGAFWYEYENHQDFELVMTTPAQDIWGYASKFPDKVHFIPHMLDVRYFRDYKPPEGQAVQRDSVLAVMANNNWRKRFDYAIQFIHDVPWRKWRFVINNNQFFNVGEMLYSLRFLPGPHEPRDVWFGPVQDTRPLYAEAKVLINPTTGEAFSMPIAEALAAGVPHVITTDLPELRELYGNALHYVDGRPVLIPDGSVQVLPDYHHFVWALKRALSDELPVKDHSVVERYDIQNVLPKWRELLGL